MKLKSGKILACIWLVFGMFLIACISADSVYSDDNAKAVFSKAQASYQKGMRLTGMQKRVTMLKAANQFQSLVEDYGIENGKLYYNIGNAYYEAGEKGKAVLYYRKAERLIPAFMDLKYNLNLARQELNLSKPEKEWWSDIARGLFFWHFLFDYPSRRLVSIGLFTLFWFLIFLMIFNKHFLIRLALIINLVGFIAFGSSILLSVYGLFLTDAGVIISEKAQTRKGPGYSYEKVYKQELPGGTEFHLLKKQGEWWKVRLSNGDDLWLNKEDAELI